MWSCSSRSRIGARRSVICRVSSRGWGRPRCAGRRSSRSSPLSRNRATASSPEAWPRSAPGRWRPIDPRCPIPSTWPSGSSRAAQARVRSCNATSEAVRLSGALDGLVALDLATYVAAPFCCTLLGELGADVIKVEQPGGGVSYISGYPDRPPVSPGTPTIPDYLAGVMGAFGALAAIESRHGTGLGQVVDVALYEPMLRMLDEMIPLHAALGKIRERIGSGTEYVVPHDHYRARDGSWIAIACTNDRMFERLAVEAMGRPELHAEFSSMGERLRRREDLDARVQDWVGAFAADEVLARLDAASVPCSRVNSVQDLFADPQLRARENLIPVPGPGGETIWMPGIVPKLSLTPGRVTSAGPATPGTHNEEIYCGRLGLSREDLAALARRGVV